MMTRLEAFRDRAAGKLSGGMKQKLGLCGALIGEPELLVLDEPTTGVDPISRREFWDILTDLVLERGLTAIVATSYLDEAERFERVALLCGGKIISIGSPAEVRGSVNVKLREFKPVAARAAMSALDSVGLHLTRTGDRLRLATRSEDEQLLASVSESLGPEVSPSDPRPSLNDIFAARIAAERGSAGPYRRFPVKETVERSDAVPVEVAGVTKQFGSFTAVNDVSFSLRRGEVFGLLGPNGGGKTTIIKTICGLIAPSRGWARVAGLDVASAGRALRQRIGYMSQLFSLYGDLTVKENLRLYSAIYGVRGEEYRTRIG